MVAPTTLTPAHDALGRVDGLLKHLARRFPPAVRKDIYQQSVAEFLDRFGQCSPNPALLPKFAAFMHGRANRAVRNKGCRWKATRTEAGLPNNFDRGRCDDGCDLERQELCVRVRAAVDQLPERLRRAAILLYGLDGREWSQAELARELGCSHQRVWQIRQELVRKLARLLAPACGEGVPDAGR